MRTPRLRNPRSANDLQAVQVFCRIKPQKADVPSCVEVVDEHTIKTTGSRTGSQKQTLHTFTAVFGDDVGQDVIFQKLALPLVSDLLEGKNGLLLTYGVTGSGKTYALQGNKKEAGILPLALDVIFNSLEDKQTKKYVVKPDGLNGFDLQSESDAIMDRHRLDYQQRLRCPRSDFTPAAAVSRSRCSTALSVASKALFAVFISLVEVYNNNVFDLLQEEPDAPGKVLSTHVLREDAQRNVYVSGSVEVEVKSADDALRVFNTGLKRRRTGQTALNSESSRSHCVFTIRLVRTGYDEKYDEAIEDRNLLMVSQLCLVDLAGSERTSRAGTQGDRLKEASSINNSLMSLRNCIHVLREIQRAGQWQQGLATPGGTTRVVPYRDTRLTHLFKNFFEGSGRVVILVCVHQSADDYDETMHVLKFAESSQEVSTFRTPVLPPPSPATTGKRRRYAHGYMESGRSTGTTPNSTMSLPMVEEQMSSLFVELSHFDAEVDRCLARIFDASARHPSAPEPSDSSSDAIDDPMCWTDEPEQDSAPEQDRPLKRSNAKHNCLPEDAHLTTIFKTDTEPLRALITQRMDSRQRSYAAFEQELASFRAYLIDFSNADSPPIHNLNEQNEKARLEARIHQLQGQVVESTVSAKRERAEHLRKIEEYECEIERLKAELGHLLGIGQTDVKSDARKTTRRSNHDRRRPSLLNSNKQNLVSVLSRQWENRLAEQKGSKQQPARGITASTTNVPQRRVAAFNPRHRRSRSAGGDKARWLEHQETIPVPLGTVFTPTLKRQKSVTQVDLKDTLKATNYVLHHQEADSDGNVETRLYKGSIIPTAGGGSAVIFDDVEELKQTSPLSNKRDSSARKRGSKFRSLEHESGSDTSMSPRNTRRKSNKRLRSSSTTEQRESVSSTGTHSSQGSAETTSSSNYQPFGHPLSPSVNTETVRNRCQIGVTGTGGMGMFNPSPRKTRKCSRQ